MKKISNIREGMMYCINGHYHLFEGTVCVASTQMNKDVAPLPAEQLKERHERFGKFPAVVRFTVDEENNFNIFTEALSPRFWLGAVMCRFGFHDWEITKLCIFKGSKLLEEGFNRTCQRCDKEQTLKKPKKYHPSKYVWTDSNGT